MTGLTPTQALVPMALALPDCSAFAETVIPKSRNSVSEAAANIIGRSLEERRDCWKTHMQDIVAKQRQKKRKREEKKDSLPGESASKKPFDLKLKISVQRDKNSTSLTYISSPKRARTIPDADLGLSVDVLTPSSPVATSLHASKPQKNPLIEAILAGDFNLIKNLVNYKKIEVTLDHLKTTYERAVPFTGGISIVLNFLNSKTSDEVQTEFKKFLSEKESAKATKDSGTKNHRTFMLHPSALKA